MSDFEDNYEAVEWDINNPDMALVNDFAPPINTDEMPPAMVRSAPPSDGVHWVRVWLDESKKGGAVYFKDLKKDPHTGKLVDGKVVAALRPRLVNEDGSLGGIYDIKTWYASTTTPKPVPGMPPKGSALTAVCKMADKPVKMRASLGEIKDHVEQLFADAGDDGILVLVKTQWVKSIPKTVEVNGITTYATKEGTEFKDYLEIKGEKKIRSDAAKAGIADELAHIWLDPVSGDERTVTAVIQSIEDPAKYEVS